MRGHVGLAMWALLGLCTSAWAQEPHRDWTLTGELDAHYVYRDGALQEVRDNLNGVFPFRDSVAFISGTAALRLDADFGEGVHAAVELERLPYADGVNLSFGGNAIEPTIDQAYVEIRDFLADRLTVRLGQFDFSYRLRPHGEPFFFDSDAESFFSGSDRRFVRVTADRDLAASAGMRLQYEPFPIALMELAFVRRDTPANVSPADQEWAAVAYANALAGERTAIFALASMMTGPRHAETVWTLGSGIDQYFGPERVLEIFAEVYAQVGRIGPHVEKRSWALHAGARVAYESGLWAEAGLAYRSGDRSPGDGHDQAFQSAERVDRFLIVESAEFGLDWDTNVRSLQFGFGLPVSAPLSFRLDAGSFWFNQDLRDPTGARWMGETHDRIGLEIDGTVSYAIDRRVRATLRAGMLVGSEVLDALTVEGHEESWMVAAGVEGGF